MSRLKLDLVKSNADNVAGVLREINEKLRKFDDATLIRFSLRGFLNLGEPIPLTIASGAVTASSSYHSVAVETGSTDDLDTINGGMEGDILMIFNPAGASTVVAKNGTGNILLGSDYTMDSTSKMLTLRKFSSDWVELSRGI